MTLKRSLWKESGVDDTVIELRDTRSTGPESPLKASLDVAEKPGDYWAFWERVQAHAWFTLVLSQPPPSWQPSHSP